MAAVTEKDTVWMGFMDIVPVIGTVKEAVELVLAVYEGNKAVIKEKEKAVENIVKESLKKHVKKLTLADKPAPAAAAEEFSGLRNVTEQTPVLQDRAECGSDGQVFWFWAEQGGPDTADGSSEK
ncbi:uncharacterized protein LOC127985976 isoform X2 [Carassius gibelio]|uniref:uncharacterized protein LOC127985976 isoform X2 n=1 Tax=Carassius gibelio TaxID=101364 RepID=UPI002277ACA0|nr:uncharacterized protein LOC127985976 isoform X2 [Carassius gibelio]